MKVGRFLFSILIVCGVVLIPLGGYDDSPGAQLIGLVLIGGGVWGIYTHKKKTHSSR